MSKATGAVGHGMMPVGDLARLDAEAALEIRDEWLAGKLVTIIARERGINQHLPSLIVELALNVRICGCAEWHEINAMRGQLGDRARYYEEDFLGVLDMLKTTSRGKRRLVDSELERADSMAVVRAQVASPTPEGRWTAPCL